MSCPNNPKRFWIFTYDGECKYEDTYIKSALTPGNFHVNQQCQLCQSRRELIFVSTQELIRSGYKADKLNEMSGFDPMGKRPEQLK